MLTTKRTPKQRASAVSTKRLPKRRAFKPSTSADVTDARLLAGQLRALQRDVKSGFEHMDVHFKTLVERVLTAIEDVMARVTLLERRVATLEDAKAKAQ